jgi:hypothetical protein
MFRNDLLQQLTSSAGEGFTYEQGPARSTRSTEPVLNIIIYITE